MQIDFVYPKHYDLIFHVLAYFKVNNASDLYDECYIEKMAKEKADFSYDIKSDIPVLQDYYNENFERVMLINFLPYYCNDYEEMKKVLLSCDRFTQEDLQFFITPFIEMLDSESIFFFDYWEKLNIKYESVKQSTERYYIEELKKYSCVFDYFNKPCKILFSFVITQNGRGFHNDLHFAALIRFPENESNLDFSFIQLLHEYTHDFTDSLLPPNINMNDNTHALSENLVIVADYLLIKSINASFIPQYFAWIRSGHCDCLDEQNFFRIYDIDEDLKMTLTKLLNDIVNFRAE